MKNNYAFIDGQNLHMGTSTEGWRIDFGRFRKYLSDKYDVTRAFFFLGYIPKNKKLYRTIEVAGFEIIFKEVTLQGSKIKGNVDVELTLEAAVRIDDYDQAVLVTADGDFACLVRYLYGQKKLKMVLSPSRRDCSSLLKKSAQRKICALWDFRDKIRTIPALEYIDSRNIVARINLPNMHHEPDQRVEICLRAQEGLAQLEPDPNKRIKYIDFILQYANLSESEQARYEAHLQQSSYKEEIMGPVQQAIENSLRQGVQQGVQQGREEGIQQGWEKGIQQGAHEKAVEMARTLVSKGVATDVISDASGLSEEEIRKLLVH